ncbi:MAG TPA: DUF4386 domain-containing protein [Gemmatimonadales bacterium]|nr:DUF4386 domain-containing protein [Gemmatimonadales bacterium]
MRTSADAGPQPYARLAGFFYLLTIIGGLGALASTSARWAGNLLGGLAYIAVTVLLYHLLRPVHRGISLVAACFSLIGITLGLLRLFQVIHGFPVNDLVFFGVYCLLLGYLVFRSGFLPRMVGVLLTIAGLGWLTYLSPPFAHAIAPWNMIPGIVGEGALTLWLLVFGVNVAKWRARAGPER